MALQVLVDGRTITTRPPASSRPGCGVDGNYQPGQPPRRRHDASERFTLLHEFGHRLIEYDDVLNNDVTLTDAERRDEMICNEVAAAVLLPDDVVEAHLPTGSFTAEDVARLHHARPASRMACCVAAAR